MKIWHHFICARLMPTTHLTEVTRDRALLLSSIKKGLTINVGHWILGNIIHAAKNVSIGIPHLTLVTELIATVGVSTLNQEILHLKNPLNRKAIAWITRAEDSDDGSGASASGAGPHSRPDRARLGR